MDSEPTGGGRTPAQGPPRRRAGRRAAATGVLLLALAGCAFNRSTTVTDPVATAPATAQAARPAAGLPPHDAAACVATARQLEAKGHLAEAVAQYERALGFDPGLRERLARRLAVLYDRMGDDEKALATYREALRRTPEDADLINDVGCFHSARGAFAEAEWWLRLALEVDPGCRRAWGNLGTALALQGREQESLEAFSHVVKPAEACSNLGVLLAKQGHEERARSAFSRALALDPSLAQPRLFLGALDRRHSPGADAPADSMAAAARVDVTPISP